MGRKVEESHKIIEQTDYGAADLIKQQNIAGDFVLGENEEETQEADTGKEEDQQKKEQQEGDKISTADQEESLQELLGNSVGTAENSAELAEKQKEAFEGTVVLTGAATYLDSGVRYFKNKPIKVTDQRTYEQLLRTRLFVRV